MGSKCVEFVQIEKGMVGKNPLIGYDFCCKNWTESTSDTEEEEEGFHITEQYSIMGRINVGYRFRRESEEECW